MTNINYSYNEIYKITQQACGENNIDKVKDILSSNSYSTLTQEQKEEYVLMSASISHYFSGLGKDILQYLILEYGIQEFDSAKQYFKDEIKDMFFKSKLNEELNLELKIQQNIHKKSPKV